MDLSWFMVFLGLIERCTCPCKDIVVGLFVDVATGQWKRVPNIPLFWQQFKHEDLRAAVPLADSLTYFIKPRIGVRRPICSRCRLGGQAVEWSTPFLVLLRCFYFNIGCTKRLLRGFCLIVFVWGSLCKSKISCGKGLQSCLQGDTLCLRSMYLQLIDWRVDWNLERKSIGFILVNFHLFKRMVSGKLVVCNDRMQCIMCT